MMEHRRPLRYLDEAERLNTRLTFGFPERSRIGMAVECLPQTDNWPIITPMIGPMLAWYFYPCDWTAQVGLNVRLHTVGRRQRMPGKRAPEVANATRFHGGGRRLKFFKDGRLGVLITNLIAEKDGSALELPRRVAERQFGALFHNDGRKTTMMHGFALRPGVCPDFGPLRNRVQIEHIAGDETIPLNFHRLLCSWSALDLTTANRTSNTGVEGRCGGQSLTV